MSAVTNSGRTRRLYLNSTDAKHPIYDEVQYYQQSGGLLDKDLYYENQAVSNFDLGPAQLVKKPNERIGLSLIKANFNGDIGLYNDAEDIWSGSDQQDYPYEFGFFINDAPVTTTLGNEMRIAFTSGTAASDVKVNSHFFLALPGTMRRTMMNSIDIINNFLSFRSTNPVQLKVSAYSKALYTDGAAPSGSQLIAYLDNRYFNDPTFRYFKKSHKSFYRDLGINTDTLAVYTNLNLGYVKPKIQFTENRYPQYQDKPDFLGEYYLQYGTLPPSQELWVAANTFTFTANTGKYFLFRKDTVTPDGPKTYIIFFKEGEGWLAMKQDLVEPEHDFTGDPAVESEFLTANTGVANSYMYPESNDFVTMNRRFNSYGENRLQHQIYPVAANPSPLFVKMDRNCNSYATMSDGARDILAMCPILPENQSLSFYFDDGTATSPPDPPPTQERRWAIDTMSAIGQWKDSAGGVTRPSPLDTLGGFSSDNAGSDPNAIGYIGDTGTFTTGMFAWAMGGGTLNCFSNSSGVWAADPNNDLLLQLGGQPAGSLVATNFTPGCIGTLIRGIGTPAQSNGTWEVIPTTNAFSLSVAASSGNPAYTATCNIGVPTGAGGTGASTPNKCMYDPSDNTRYWLVPGAGVPSIQIQASGTYEIVAGSNTNLGDIKLKPLYQTQGGTGPGGYALWSIDPDQDESHLNLSDAITTLNPRVPYYQGTTHYYTSNLYVGTWLESEAAGTAVPVNYQFVNLDGADDYIEIDGLSDGVLNWTKSWSIGLHMKYIDNPIEGVKRCLFRRNNNAVYFSKGSGNWGVYVTAMDGEYDPALYPGLPHSHGANSWYVPNDDSKFLFTYNHISGKFMWYVDGDRKATVQLTSEEMTKGLVENPDYVGLPTPINAACIDPLNSNQIMFFVGDYYYIYNLTTKAYVSKTLITDSFSLTTTPIHNVVRNNMNFSTDLAGQLLIYETNGMMTRYTASASGFVCDNPSSSFWRGNESWKMHDAATLEHFTGQGSLVFKDNQFWESHDANGTFVGWTTYGGSGQAFEGLPHDLDGCVTDTVGGKVYCYKNGIEYDINYDKSTNPHTFTVNSQKAFGGDAPALPPLKVGEANGFVPYGGAYWDGKVSDLLIMNTNLVYQSQQVTDYFNDDDYSTHEYYNAVTNYLPLGEDDYPAVVDDVGTATGEHKNGSSSDFVTGDPLPAGHPLLTRGGGGDAAAEDPSSTTLTIKNQMVQGATVAYTNLDYTGSHKYISDTMLPSLELTLKDEFYQTKSTNNPIDYEVEVKYVGDI